MLILASASPRRKEMLENHGLKAKIIPADIDERSLLNESPEKLVRRLAETKAGKIASIHPAATVLAADTVVAWGPEILGKPADFIETWFSCSPLV